MSVDVATDLLGEIVEVYARDNFGDCAYRLRSRGHVRAVFVVEKRLMILVEHDLGYDSVVYDDRAKDGGFEAYCLYEHRVRAVQRCARCYEWDQKRLLLQGNAPPAEIMWEHKDGAGCKKVGHGG